MHKAYSDLFVNRAAQMVGAAKALTAINHSGLKGQLREVVARDLLRPFLPPQYIVGNGEIANYIGQTSKQIDMLIADSRVLPAMLIDQASGIFPLEAVLMTIEVKSKITLAELRSSEISAAEVLKFQHAAPLGKRAHPLGYRIEHVIPYILAFDTDLDAKSKSEVERYDELLAGQPPSILGLCVVGRGFWFRVGKDWKTWSWPMLHGEVLGFVTSVVNTCARISSTRLQPDMRSYLL